MRETATASRSRHQLTSLLGRAIAEYAIDTSDEAPLAIFPFLSHINGMKTTLELPDQLFHEAKTRAAAQKRKLKDLVSDGLRTVLQNQGTSVVAADEARNVLNALDDILRCPPPAAGRTAALQAEARKLRTEGWSREEM